MSRQKQIKRKEYRCAKDTTHDGEDFNSHVSDLFFYFLFFSDGRGGKKFGGDLRIEKDEVKKTEKEGAKDEK